MPKTSQEWVDDLIARSGSIGGKTHINGADELEIRIGKILAVGICGVIERLDDITEELKKIEEHQAQIAGGP